MAETIFEEYILPAHLACYLVNGDASGYSDEEIEEIDKFVDEKSLGFCTGVDSEDTYFSPFNDMNNMGNDVCKFTFVKLEKLEPFDETKIILAVDSHYGVYSPQTFVERYLDQIQGADDIDLITVLYGPDEEGYWDAWNDIIDSSVLIDGVKHGIWDVEDTWLVPENMDISKWEMNQ